MSYSLTEAAARLEAAVERLAQAAARVPSRPAAGGVPAEDVAALSARLEATLARLRAALPEGEEAGLPDDGDEPGDGSRPLAG